ncbi:hypothetical protein [Taklimakanibacter lacteus]|uniref:hypothetical protein n=1 Tax=Taklimakanibacter lacteus TaxID=2268456 RepID=UPI000E672ED0
MPVLGPQTAIAIEQFASRVTVPLLLKDTKHGVVPHGTGTFFDIGGRVFLVVAAHLLDDIELSKLAVPVGPRGPEVLTLSPFDTYRPQDIDLDVAIVEPTDMDLLAKFRKHWRFLDLSNVAVPSQDGAFILCGYPASITLRRGDKLGGQLLTFYTERLGTPPNLAIFRDRPHDPSVDFFFKYDETAMLVNTADDGETPELPGASGASIWEWSELPKDGIWTPEAALKVVAVQSSWNERTKKWFRATGWQVVFNLLRQAGVLGLPANSIVKQP